MPDGSTVPGPHGPLAAKTVAEGLLLVGHGSRRGDPAAERMLARHAASLAAGAGFAEVATATLFGGAGPAAALCRIATPRVAIVPVFMSDGYYVRELLPARLTEKTGFAGGARPALRLCPPVGLDPLLASLVADRAGTACRDFGLEPTACSLLIVGHGSTKGPDSREATERQAGRVRATGRFAAVLTAYLEEPPAIAAALETLPGLVVIVALFAAAGLHAGRDIVEAIAATHREDVIYLGAIGEDPGLVPVIRRCAATRT